MQNAILVIRNAKTQEKALVYTEVYNSAIPVLGGQPVTDDSKVVDVSDVLFVHVVFVSHLLNNAIRGRLDITIKPI